MKSIHVRLSDQEEAELLRQAEASGRTVSEVVRDALCADPERSTSLKTATSKEVEELGKRLEVWAGKVEAACEKLTVLEGMLAEVSELKGGQAELAGRVENAEEELRALSQNVTRLVDLQVEEREAPFGMNRTFLQVAIMAAFTLARGTFSHNPEAWEPYKEEARRRALKTEGGTP